jgi:acyl carrier protein
MLCSAQRMTYLKDLGLDHDSLALRAEESQGKAAQLELWKGQVDATKNALVLKSDDEIEQYVVSITKDYFRTTRKASVTLDSEFSGHGLDSLDVVELVIRVEDELGYMIDAENLEKFKKPRHFVNFIKQMEGYKQEFNKMPMGPDTKYSFSFKETFPGIPFISQ